MVDTASGTPEHPSSAAAQPPAEELSAEAKEAARAAAAEAALKPRRQVTIDIRAHNDIPETDVAGIKTAVENLVTVLEAAHLEVRAKVTGDVIPDVLPESAAPKMPAPPFVIEKKSTPAA
jgi:hypothetical protein